MRFVMSPGIGVVAELTGVRSSADRCEIDLVADPQNWMLIDGGLLFHLDDPAQVGGLPPVVAAGLPVRFSLRLDDEIRRAAAAASPAALRRQLDREADDPLHAVDSWFLTEVHQGPEEHPDISFATSFATSPEVHAGAGTGHPAFEVTVSSREPAVDTPLSPLLALAAGMLDDVELKYERIGPALLRVPVHTADVDYNVLVHAVARDSQLAVYATADENIPGPRRPSVMELVTRINPLLVGSWLEIGLDDGVVSARASLLLEGITLTDDTFVENVVSAAMDTIERFWPAIHAVAFEGLEPADFPQIDDEPSS